MTKKQTVHDSRAEKRFSKWPGGLTGFIADYQACRCTIADATKITGVEFRAIRRLLTARGVTLKTRSHAQKVSYELNPLRIEKAKAALRVSTSFRRPEVIRKGAEARKKLFRVDPTRHINYKASMTVTEAKFASHLKACGVYFVFNFPTSGYWIDFILPDHRLGIEIQSHNRTPNADRHSAITSGGIVPNLIYIHTRLIATRGDEWTENLVRLIKSGGLDPSSLGEYLMIAGQTERARTVHGGWRDCHGYKFVRPFVTV